MKVGNKVRAIRDIYWKELVYNYKGKRVGIPKGTEGIIDYIYDDGWIGIKGLDEAGIRNFYDKTLSVDWLACPVDAFEII